MKTRKRERSKIREQQKASWSKPSRSRKDVMAEKPVCVRSPPMTMQA